MISLNSFLVLKKLTVANISIESRQVKAKYIIEKFDGERVSIDHIYSYEHSYFRKKNPGDVNLASMMLAQVALNYGLFFETIEFDGLYDEADKSFIREMMENTSREIVTNKLLIKNEFLLSPFNELKAEKRSSYTQANIQFINTSYANLVLLRESEESDLNKYAILSSGGKDSLLSYGIIKEIGEAYPVFINEAGRHWFTAVNSYRHYKETEANTEKPWCNSDRVFNWMLKHLEFIRPNYSSIRADYYPIRLWTVAVFLFGVLPIVRKKQIGNILIGNEYDTTMKTSFEGITHYQGLFDQSKYFDNALSRYYMRKGWRIYQYSILRSMSELLIMKVLIKRYPDLQQEQISCHAAHEVDGRMYPCGKCEKCRRIIGMIKALDEDPGRCGYSEKQITDGLHALEKQSVKQIGSDASHLYYMLAEKNLIERNPHTEKYAKEHKEILKLRFDKERSMLEDLPIHVREPLFKILLKYANGAVSRENMRWEEIKLDTELINNIEYKLSQKNS